MDNLQFNLDAFKVSQEALKSGITERIEQLAQPIKRGPKWDGELKDYTGLAYKIITFIAKLLKTMIIFHNTEFHLLWF